MKKIRIINDSDVKRILFGAPTGEKQPRAFIELEDEALVFNDPTIANISRAFTWVWNHPTCRVMEMAHKRFLPEEVKKNYGLDQLIETDRSQDEIQKDIDALFLAGKDAAQKKLT